MTLKSLTGRLFKTPHRLVGSIEQKIEYIIIVDSIDPFNRTKMFCTKNNVAPSIDLGR